MKFSLKSRWKWSLIILAVLVLLSIYQYNSQLWKKSVELYELLHDRQQLKISILSYGPYSPLAYILIQVAQVVVAPIPGGAIEFLGGYLFGVKAGFFYSMIGVVLGSWIAFSLARIFEKLAVEKFVSPQIIRKFDYLIGHEGLILSFLLFLIPGFPKDALCYLLGLTPMHTGIFLIISTIGRVPGTLMACLQGGKAFEHQYKTFLILLGISGLVILVFYIYHEEIHRWLKRLRKVKS
ncbi:MAG: TVP38/TMEM64 family protein [Syntrophaceae bacterium]|nr:TVP38/TMEM64 family protein [Syntrophaceae bacterium]